MGRTIGGYRRRLLSQALVTLVVNDLQTEARWVDSAVTPKEESTENGLGTEVKNTIEDGLRIWCDDVATLRQTPSDRVEEPEEGCPSATDEECATNITTKLVGVGTGFEEKHVCDEKEGGTTEDVVSPLVAAVHEGTRQTSDDHDLVDENGVGDCRPWKARRKEQVHKQERRGDDPVDVADIENLTSGALDDWVATLELDVNRCPAKIGAHGEICDTSDHGDGGCDVVEDTLDTRLGCTEAEEGYRGCSHYRADRPVPIGTASGDGDLGRSLVGNVVAGDCDAQSVKECPHDRTMELTVGGQGIVAGTLE